MQEFLQKIISWAENDNSVRMLIQTGSHTRIDNSSDELSDFDIEMFVDDVGRFADSNRWIKEIDDVWVCLPLTNSVGDPTRLVIFNGGYKVDFTLNKLKDIEQIKKDGYDDYFNKGFKILLDKDNLGKDLPSPSYKTQFTKKPTQEEFTALVEEFFFETYHIPKYVKRGSLWTVKMRDWGIKELLLRMLEWYEKSLHGFDYDTWYAGAKLEKWVERNIYDELQNTFAHFDKEDSLRALDATIKLFRRIAKETAKNLDLIYPEEVDQNITGYIEKISNDSNS
ncbi:MAG TPA: aminoglycoside 6-adenylyltransferase [Patescibacteria group bacterium]|nr:aminoglycoside 6-adenylyltransferase [Patescibacteria group bacterium]